MNSRIAALLGTVLMASVGCGSSSPGQIDAGTGKGGGAGGSAGKGGSGAGGSAGKGGSGAGGSAGKGGSGTGGAGAAGKDGGPSTDGNASVDAGIDAPVGPFSIGGTVSGLAGTGLIFADGAGHQLTITANGAFAFSIKLAAGTAVAVTAAQQPTTP